MPARQSSNASKAPAAKKFDFKAFSRSSSKGAGTSRGASSSSATGKKEARTTTKVVEAVVQSGENEGKKSGRRYFVFDPRFGLNDAAKELVQPHVLKGDEIKKYNKELGGFPVLVHSPNQAQEMHTALRDNLEHGAKDLPEAIELGTWSAGPVIQVVTVSNVSLGADLEETVDALVLEGNVYPIYPDMKAHVKYQFVRGLHGKKGLDKWVRVIGDGECAADLVQATAKVLADHGWQCQTAEADAAACDSDSDEEE